MKPHGRKMKPRKRIRKYSLEQAIEATLAPGCYISHEEEGAFLDGLQALANEVGNLIAKDPHRAARLYEIYIAACHEKADEVHDEGGYFGMLVDDLFRGWIKARQAAGADPGDTAESLAGWMEDDPYGFCYHLEREAVKVLDRKGLDAFASLVQSKIKFTSETEEADCRKEHSAWKWGRVLKTLMAAQRKVDSYIALCERTGFEGEDWRIIADLYRRKKRPEAALSWVERGLDAAEKDGSRVSCEYDLREMRRSLQAALGRQGEALESAWAEFRKHPSEFTYETLMRYVPKREMKTWRLKAMNASEKGDLSSQIALWTAMKEKERITERLRRATDEELENISHLTTEPLARRFERTHPGIAARLHQAQCMRILNAGKSKYYDAALGNLEQARECYEKAGLSSAWKTLVKNIRNRHYRKAGFMAGFERIASGGTKPKKQTFLDRAKARWKRMSKK